MTGELPIAFVSTAKPPALEIRVNFGIVAGRAATPAEIDELARRLVPDVGSVSIVSEERHEIGEEAGGSLHQVRVEVGPDRLPVSDEERSELARRLVSAAERWAEACADERRAEVSEP